MKLLGLYTQNVPELNVRLVYGFKRAYFNTIRRYDARGAEVVIKFIKRK